MKRIHAIAALMFVGSIIATAAPTEDKVPKVEITYKVEMSFDAVVEKASPVLDVQYDVMIKELELVGSDTTVEVILIVDADLPEERSRSKDRHWRNRDHENLLATTHDNRGKKSIFETAYRVPQSLVLLC